jgi:D-alanyl-lipoteichoic acid acyltransferase DltB (MBOAT superfamily)
MLFNSYEFLFFFLPITLAGYFLLNRQRLTIAANSWLLFASLFFYGWWNIVYLPLILGSILFNYTIGNLLIDTDYLKKRIVTKKGIFVFGILVNVLFLGYFKYMDFFIGNANTLLGTNLPLLKIVLPLGISFFTITQIAFLVDAYEGLVEERKLLNYALFVTFFPHLLAGPILHHKEMMPQFDRTRNKVLNYKNLSLGIYLFFIGLFKKIILADQFSVWAKAGFDTATSLNLLEAWTASIAYTFQLYFDFSGYSDMAIGVGLMFNIRLPINFNSPYKAVNIIEFWKRWHITLSNFITTYLYTPIVRSFSKITFTKSMIAIFVAMFISGFWHGAGWTFIIWGSLHGAALVVNHYWRKLKIRMPAFLGWFITFNFINLAFVFFRAKEWKDALKVFRGMFGMSGVMLPRGYAKLTFLKGLDIQFGKDWLDAVKGGVHIDTVIWTTIISFVIILAARNSNQMTGEFRPGWRSLVFIVFVAFWSFFNMSKVSEFLYFQF